MNKTKCPYCGDYVSNLFMLLEEAVYQSMSDEEWRKYKNERLFQIGNLK